jgi:uncharacterized protein YbcC (UPF0753/DUF2309 family)
MEYNLGRVYSVWLKPKTSSGLARQWTSLIQAKQDLNLKQCRQDIEMISSDTVFKSCF